MAEKARYLHRLHYRWSQLEADRCSINIGSPTHPIPKVDRFLRLEDDKDYGDNWPTAPSDSPFEQARFAACAGVYKTMNYTTFRKNGCLKLTEVELYFLSRYMTKETSSEWVVVYLGLGNGERFRYLRDDFFPKLAVIAYDPGNDFYPTETQDYQRNADLWNGDGTDFTFLVRCMDTEKDVGWMKDKYPDRKMLLISDIRGLSKHEDGFGYASRTGGNLDCMKDQDVQWHAIQALKPVSSIVKFTVADIRKQFFEYVPGEILLQVYCFLGTLETRLLIEGVPETRKRYNGWEMFEKLMFHHEHMRGQVYETSRCGDNCTRVFCHCFDCTVLWDTVSAYAAQNAVDPYKIMKDLVGYHVYTPGRLGWNRKLPNSSQDDQLTLRWFDVLWACERGHVMEAIAALEADSSRFQDDDKSAETEWERIAEAIKESQPSLSERLRIAKPANKDEFIQVLGRLYDPFTLIRTEVNGLYYN